MCNGSINMTGDCFIRVSHEVALHSLFYTMLPIRSILIAVSTTSLMAHETTSSKA